MISKKEQIGHAIGGVGHNLIYALFSGFLLIFYTDIFGLSGTFTAILFLVARIWDAINDLLMGMLADKTKSRFGRYRVWLFAAAPIIAVALSLCFFVPDLSKGLQYVYCYITYILLGMSFTAADIPYWTLPSVITEEPTVRNKIFSVSGAVSCLASGIGAVAVPIIVSLLPEQQDGYLLCAIIFSVIGIICYWTCGALVRERIVPAQNSYTFKKAIGTIVKNKPLLIIMLASLFGNLAFQMKVSVNTYYGTYALGDFGYVTYLSAMLLLGMLIGTVIVPMLISKLGSKNTMITMLIAGVVISLLYWISGYASLVVVLMFSALSAIVIGAFTVLVNSMTADTIDYAEAYLGQRSEGIITSTRTFITKLATAIAGTVAAASLDLIHYIPNEIQTDSVKQAFHNMMSLVPAVLYGIGLMIICFYPLGKEAFAKLTEDLKVKRGE